ncbi:MAG: FAD-binding oxidoreductase [bacterium]|nr:FAD-binding oxidoreductase [bacterium]
MDNILEKLARIIGDAYVSNAEEEKFIYSRDQGLQQPHFPDYVAMPGSTEEVQKIVFLANEEKIPIVPMGGGMVLSGLTIPLKGGIVLDMKRMNRVVEVNETSRYAVVQGGTGHGTLKAYLEKNHPTVKHSLPDSPPGSTIAGNVAIHGSGHLSQSEGGFHSEMVTGMEVVLPTGEIIKAGSCSTVEGWFSRAPLPDLAGLFLGWNGTTGIITRVAIKLYPKPLLEDVLLFLMDDLDKIADVITRLTTTGMVEDLVVVVKSERQWIGKSQLIKAVVTANTDFEMASRKKIIRESLRDYYETKEAGFLPVPMSMKGELLDAPAKNVTAFADTLKGGGFEYVGSIMPLEKIGEASRKGLEIGEKNKVRYSMGARVIGRGHSIMFFNSYAFNRADAESMERAEQALVDSNKAALEMGGIPWKAEAPAQQYILAQMDPETINLMNRLRKVLDPNKIMNPGNWEVK